MTKPSNLDEYRLWTQKALGVDFSDPRQANLYETNVNNVRTFVAQHPFSVQFSEQASHWMSAYRKDTNSDLFMGPPELRLSVKPFASVIEKMYRMNILWNKNYPSEPAKGWVNPMNLYSKIDDLVRGTLVCRFADGPSFVTSQVSQYADSLGLVGHGYSQERDDGYYAFHCYVAFQVDLFDGEWNSVRSNVKVEIQLTTQPQEVLRGLTHPLYERRRLQADDKSGKWKWEFGSSRFKLAYLGHSLHLLESMILDSREGLLNKKSEREDPGGQENA
jgi:ppGpp synthetase/RelA/SpoT-type nucleotidyltranferase